MTSSSALSHLPQPRPERGGGRALVLFALLLLCVAGGAAFWLSRDAASRQTYREHFAHWLAKTPMAALAPYVYTSPSSPLGRVTHPSTQPGTLAGQAVQGTVPALPPAAAADTADGATLPADAQTEEAPHAGSPAEIPSPVLATVTEDEVVRPLFMTSLARWLVMRFHPDKDGGTLQMQVQALNLRFGGQMPGLVRPESSSREITHRAAVLRYAFNPPMLTALYTLYVDRFMDALREAAENPHEGRAALSPVQTDAFFKACGGRFAAYAAALRALVGMEDFAVRMCHAHTLLQQALDAHQQMTEAIFALDTAREAGSQERIEAAQLRVSGYNAQYQKFLGESQAAQRTLCADVRKASPEARSLNDETLLYIAAWIERRSAGNPQSAETIHTGARLLDDLAQRLRTSASVAR